jgi:hypothetical protein
MTRGGQRNPGTTSPAACAASERTRAAEAKWVVVGVVMTGHLLKRV